MTTLTDSDIDRLLREAEARLPSNQGDSRPDGTAAAAAASYVPPLKDGAAEGAGAQTSTPSRMTEPREKLSVRDARPKVVKKKDTAGADWFHMPRAEATAELKNEAQLIALRGALAAGKQHYKQGHARRGLPTYAHQGVLRDGGRADPSRTSRRGQAGKSVLGGVLESGDTLGYLKRKYSDIQAAKQSGGKTWYADMTKRRYKR